MNIFDHMVIRIRNLVLEDIMDTDKYELKKMFSWSKNYNNGPWTNEEHALFIKCLKEHGKDWPKLKEMIPTRTRTQIKSHCRRYFSQVKKHFNVQDPMEYILNNPCENPRIYKRDRYGSQDKEKDCRKDPKEAIFVEKSMTDSNKEFKKTHNNASKFDGKHEKFKLLNKRSLKSLLKASEDSEIGTDKMMTYEQVESPSRQEMGGLRSINKDKREFTLYQSNQSSQKYFPSEYPNYSYSPDKSLLVKNSQTEVSGNLKSSKATWPAKPAQYLDSFVHPEQDLNLSINFIIESNLSSYCLCQFSNLGTHTNQRSYSNLSSYNHSDTKIVDEKQALLQREQLSTKEVELLLPYFCLCDQ
ncbi:unnamed protein product [Moneuplotes crassus]|uniref:Uncharacterized protein n=1 Tax=Euplotes crassus TaxID=5936 RepID=A0AAD1XWC2_EUPCR|nr:unnamed protein product [Moneuplotes crassus]